MSLGITVCRECRHRRRHRHSGQTPTRRSESPPEPRVSGSGLRCPPFIRGITQPLTIPRVGERPAHLEVFEHEAAVVRRIFDDYVHKDLSMRQIAKGLNYDGISSPSGRAVWGVSTIARILRNEAYIGRVYANRTEAVLDRRLAGKTRQVPRPRDQWIAIAVPAALDEELFEAAQRVSRDNSQWSPRRAESGYWLLRGLVKLVFDSRKSKPVVSQ